MNAHAATVLPHFSTSSAAAKQVPPAAIRSSIMRTFSPGCSASV